LTYNNGTLCAGQKSQYKLTAPLGEQPQRSAVLAAVGGAQ